MRRWAWMASLLLVLGAMGRADAGPPAPDPALSLPGGVRLILQPEPDTSLVAISLLIRTERDTTLQERATGDIVSHALWYGSSERTEAWTAALIGDIGGVFETLRTPDYVGVTLLTVPEKVEEAVSTLSDAVKHANFTTEALGKARRDLMRDHEEDPSGLTTLSRMVTQALSPLEQPDADSWGRVTRAQATDYFQTHYLAGRTVISVAGQFKPDRVQAAFAAYLFDFHRASHEFFDGRGAGLPRPALHRLLRPAWEHSTACVVVGAAAPRVDSPDYPAYLVLSALLGSGHTSRLYRALREKEGLGYHLGLLARTDQAAPLLAYLEWDPERASTPGSPLPPFPEAALGRLNAQFDRLVAGPPAEGELLRARQLALTREALRHERVRDRAFLAGWYEVMGLGNDFDTILARRIAAVTRDDCFRVAKRYFRTRACIAGAPLPLR